MYKFFTEDTNFVWKGQEKMLILLLVAMYANKLTNKFRDREGNNQSIASILLFITLLFSGRV